MGKAFYVLRLTDCGAELTQACGILQPPPQLPFLDQMRCSRSLQGPEPARLRLQQMYGKQPQQAGPLHREHEWLESLCCPALLLAQASFEVARLGQQEARATEDRTRLQHHGQPSDTHCLC